MGKKIASTAPVRKNGVTRKSFEKASGKLSYLFNQAADDQSQAEKIRLWNEFIPLTPAAAAKILRRDLPSETTISLDLDDMGAGEITFYAEETFNDDGCFDLEEKILDAGIVRVQNGHQGKGYGRTLFRNQAEFFYACGVRHFEISAGLDNGGYTWARVGFLPDDVKDEDFKRYVAGPAQKTLDILKPLLTKTEKQQIQKYLRFKDKEDLWRIADSAIDLGARLQNVFNKATGRGEGESRKLVKSLRSHFPEELFSYMEDRALKGQSVNIGRLLLTGTSWEGRIDMDDPKQMRRLGNYTGGFKYLQFR